MMHGEQDGWEEEYMEHWTWWTWAAGSLLTWGEQSLTVLLVWSVWLPVVTSPQGLDFGDNIK